MSKTKESIESVENNNNQEHSQEKLVLPELIDAHYAAFGIVYCSPKYHTKDKEGNLSCDHDKLDKEFANFIDCDVETAQAVRNKIATETLFITEWVTQDINKILATIGSLK